MIQKIKNFFGMKKNEAEAVSPLANTHGEAYIDTAVKILIVVVLGALLMATLYLLFNGTILPNVANTINNLFNYKSATSLS